MKKILASNCGDGHIQAFPVTDDCFGKTTGADTISTVGKSLIMFDTDLTIYTGNASNTFGLDAMTPLSVELVDSIHVSAATNYALIPVNIDDKS